MNTTIRIDNKRSIRYLPFFLYINLITHKLIIIYTGCPGKKSTPFNWIFSMISNKFELKGVLFSRHSCYFQAKKTKQKHSFVLSNVRDFSLNSVYLEGDY